MSEEPEQPKEKEPSLPGEDENHAQVPAERLFLVQAESLRVQNRLDEAIETCQKGLQTAPDLLPGRLLLGRCYLEKEMYEEAKRELEKVARLIEECLPVYKLLSRVYVHERKDVDKALEAVRRALYFTSQEVARKKAIPLEMDSVTQTPPSSQPASSKRPFPNEWIDEPRSSIQTDTLAEIYIKQGKMEKALAIYDKILAGDPENTQAREKQDELRKAIQKSREAKARGKVIQELEAWLKKFSSS